MLDKDKQEYLIMILEQIEKGVMKCDSLKDFTNIFDKQVVTENPF